MGFPAEQKRKLLLIARKAIEYFAEHGEEPGALKEVDIDEFEMARGVFVTLKENGELRGCIGFPMPIMPLGKAVVKAAIAAAFDDPRFSSVTKEEIRELEIEISVLTVPEQVKVARPEEYLKKIKIGRDGLIIEFMGYSGLLLPQVPVEEGWGVEEYLDFLCRKAGLPPETWKQRPVSIKAFQAEIMH
ncbi:MAG: AmmeMemoRadiSam system protein A [Candidatus ainarchaeum sp.]|nr:AmmeMemoRadiSam system protein A [Candidatus ainarchaeum sp.]